MDHDQQLSKMDPKLKEAYERVMGTKASDHHDIQPPTHQAENTVSPLPANTQVTPISPAQQAINQATSTPNHPPITQSPPPANPVTPPQAPHPMEMVKTTPYVAEPPLRRSTETVHMAAPLVTPHPVHKPQPPVEGIKKKSKISPVLITVLLLIFFAIYTIIWMIILAVPIPFFPK